MKKLLYLCVILFFIVSPFSTTFANKAKTIPFTMKNVDFLFVQLANSAELTSIPGKNKIYKLTLHNVNPIINYFSDRPNRITGIITVKEFVHDWYASYPNSFSKDAPNAELHVTQINNNQKSLEFAAELTNPVYDSTQKTLVYTIRPLQGKQRDAWPEDGKFAATSLFIDGFCSTCGF